MSYSVKKISIFNLIALNSVAKILKDCGDDMYQKYQLSHWKNYYIKTMLIVVYTALKHKVYGVYDGADNMIATFQTRELSDGLHFSKLAVSPKASRRGIGSYCLEKMEHLAKDKGLLCLKCEVYDKSKHAYNFYLKHGFKEVGKVETMKYTEVALMKNL